MRRVKPIIRTILAAEEAWRGFDVFDGPNSQDLWVSAGPVKEGLGGRVHTWRYPMETHAIPMQRGGRVSMALDPKHLVEVTTQGVRERLEWELGPPPQAAAVAAATAAAAAAAAAPTAASPSAATAAAAAATNPPPAAGFNPARTCDSPRVQEPTRERARSPTTQQQGAHSHRPSLTRSRHDPGSSTSYMPPPPEAPMPPQASPSPPPALSSSSSPAHSSGPSSPRARPAAATLSQRSFPERGRNLSGRAAHSGDPPSGPLW
ncbi:hypothetical protein DUNSADRAFT_6406 [Dunaliella salina]|uniref:Uncharacterized protein n=1 Tax=Dunaliella salina TaxID=3046 RepID=A0ABQ7H6S1_DUNSA|nr:hypothetical protein DUNSADRAFT_6406 [Dunaliella salina]|eukprot:KAF5842556.1 hypothetical protein DUNSADRAFT_6406 [Dunaliella salina]